MTYAIATINPFFSRRIQRDATRNEARDQTVYARLPMAPLNASPVPHLTSLYHFDRAGEYGDRKWPGNCGGNLIKDLLTYFKPGMVFDPMSGSGTARDVCQEMGIPCFAFDIHQGFDACDAAQFPEPESFDFIWAHPPYWRQKLYSDDLRDLSRCTTLEDFLRRYGQFIRNSAQALKPGGKVELIRRCLGCSIDELVVNDVRVGSTEIVIELTEFYIDALLTLRLEIRDRARRYSVTPPDSRRTYAPGFSLEGEEKKEFFNQLRDTVESIILITVPEDPTIRNRALIGQFTMPSDG